jgi:membrane protease YdiL (CAAX protease family)
MNDIRSYFALYDRSPLIRLIISLLIIAVFGMLLLTLMFLVGALIFGIDPTTISESLLSETGEANIDFLRYLVIMQDICLFIFPAIIILFLFEPDYPKSHVDLKVPRINEIALVILLAFCIFPVTSFTGELNSGLHLPDWLSGVEKWMTEKEDNADRLIGLLITSDTFWIMLLNLVMIAVLPSIGEEMIFRGVFQKIFYGFFKSGHPAIWITAIIFSTLHFQFFGLIPRLILGLVFGYLYFWSRTLWLPVIAHFVNNAVPVIGEYIKDMNYMTTQTDVVLWKQVIGLPVPIIAGSLILWYFKNKSRNNSRTELNQSGIADS